MRYFQLQQVEKIDVNTALNSHCSPVNNETVSCEVHRNFHVTEKIKKAIFVNYNEK